MFKKKIPFGEIKNASYFFIEEQRTEEEINRNLQKKSRKKLFKEVIKNKLRCMILGKKER